MLTSEITQNVFRIPVTLPNSPLKVLNSYFIKDPVRSLLIDTGFYLDACREALLAGLTELGEYPGDFDIFLTHMHSDHSGLAADVISDGMRILISETDLKLLNTTKKREKVILDDIAKRYGEAGMPEYIIENFTIISPAISFSSPTESTQYVGIPDGEMIYTGGYALRCTWTPGHSPGHMCLWDEAKGLFFSGDHVLFDITPNITSWSFVYDSLGDYLDSLRAVSKYDVKLALPGHRDTGDFNARVEALLRHHQIRLAEVERIVGEFPESTAYEIAGKMKWKIRANSWADFPDPQKIFAVGECLSHLDYLLLRDKITRGKAGNVYRYYK